MIKVNRKMQSSEQNHNIRPTLKSKQIDQNRNIPPQSLSKIPQKATIVKTPFQLLLRG